MLLCVCLWGWAWQIRLSPSPIYQLGVKIGLSSLAGSHRGDFFGVYIHSICPQRQGESGHRFVYLGHQEDGLCHWLLYGRISGHEEASLVKSLGIRERVKSFLLASLAMQSILAPKKQAAVLQRFIPRQTQVLGAAARKPKPSTSSLHQKKAEGGCCLLSPLSKTGDQRQEGPTPELWPLNQACGDKSKL